MPDGIEDILTRGPFRIAGTPCAPEDPLTATAICELAIASFHPNFRDGTKVPRSLAEQECWEMPMAKVPDIPSII